MTATVTDLFCGAGGSSLGAEAAGMRLTMAANHWATAIEVHQAHFPDAGHVYETTPGNRSRPTSEPLPVQGTTAQHALAHPPAYVLRRFTPRGRTGQMLTPVEDALPTAGASGSHGLVVPAGGTWNDDARSTDEPLRTVLTRDAYGLLMRNNGGGAEMCTPTDEPARTVTTKGHQSLLVPYYGQRQAQPVDRPVPTVPTRDRFALVDVEAVIDDCSFRMLEPHEIAAAMAFPDRYIPEQHTKRDRVKLAGNAVTPPVMQWICGRLLHALEEAA